MSEFDPFAVWTVKAPEVFQLKNGDATETSITISLGSCPKIPPDLVDKLVETLKAAFCYDHVMERMDPGSHRALLYASTEPRRAYEVINHVIELARQTVTKVIESAYKKEEIVGEVVGQLISSDALFGKYEEAGVGPQHAFLALVDPESPTLRPTLEELERDLEQEDTGQRLSAKVQIEARKALHWVVLTVVFRQSEGFNFLGPVLQRRAVEQWASTGTSRETRPRSTRPWARAESIAGDSTFTAWCRAS